ncbi:hypothetical protein ABZY45_15385 [Streptomyces sp. NPDC006516]|uniref:hypothetical protein n=1 Tax=Streptomyces sp. NPDC006516 TaxID=3154309 RepID=UPI0033B04D63
MLMGNDEEADFPYWSIDMPGLDERRAVELAGLVRQSGAGIEPTLVDPMLWLTLHLDRETVEVVRDALASAPTTAVTASLVESFDEWLDQSARGGEGGADSP